MKLIFLASALTLSAVSAQTPEPPLRDLLRDGLYAEEVTRDAEAAARDYEKILARAEADQPFVANALFRLAELRRKQDRQEEAVKLYQRLLTRYPNADPQAALSRGALAALGGGTPELTGDAGAITDEETKELRRLTNLAKTSPDLLKPLSVVSSASRSGWIKVVRYLVDRLEGTARQDALNTALAAC